MLATVWPEAIVSLSKDSRQSTLIKSAGGTLLLRVAASREVRIRMFVSKSEK